VQSITEFILPFRYSDFFSNPNKGIAKSKQHLEKKLIVFLLDLLPNGEWLIECETLNHTFIHSSIQKNRKKTEKNPKKKKSKQDCLQ